MAKPPDDGFMDELPGWKDEKPEHWTEKLGPNAYFEYLLSETPEQREEREEWHLKDHSKLNGPEPTIDSNRNFKPSGKGKRHRSRDFKGFLTSAEFMARMKPPDYVVAGLLLHHATYTLTGNTGHSKTLIALLLTIRVACGDWFCGRKCKQGTVAFFAGENPENVRIQFYAMCKFLNLDPNQLPIVWHEGVVNIEQAREKTIKALASHPDLALCVYDSLQAFFLGEDDSLNMPMLDTAIGFRELAEGHPNRPTSLILAHPVKNAPRDGLLPRGGSALTNELDGNLTAWMDGVVVVLHWHGKYRGMPFDPIKLETVSTKPEGLVDAEGNQMPCTVIRHMPETREAEIATQDEARQKVILKLVKDNPKTSSKDVALAINQSVTTAKRIINTLIEVKWIRRSNHLLYLMKDGILALDQEDK